MTNAAAAVGPDEPVVVYDGDCALCTGAVQFLLRHDRRRRLRFCRRTSAVAQRLLVGHRLPDPLPESMLLVHCGKVHLRTGASLRIAALLGWPWRLLAVFLVVPWFLRDLVYRIVAQNRRRWFGRSSFHPGPAERARFLDADEPQ